MIDNFLGIAVGEHYGFCHRRHSVNFFFKGQVKFPILHNTRDGSEFYVPYLSHYMYYRRRTWALGKVGGGRGGIPGLHTCLLWSLLKNITSS